MKNAVKQLRASTRAVLGVGAIFGLLLPLLVLQTAAVGPVLRNRTAIPNFIWNTMRRLLGIKIEFNKASAPLETKRPTWYVSNHMATADFVVTGSKLKGLFVAAGDLRKIPVVGGIISALAPAAKIIFVTQKRDEKNKRQDRGRIVSAFNKGENIVMFPEGRVNDGNKIELFRAGLTSILFGEKAEDLEGNEISLKQDVVVQPIAVNVKSVGGKDASSDPVLRDAYTMNGKHNVLKRIWDRLGQEQIVIELTAFEPLEPKNFPDAKELMNKAHRQIVDVVSPDQEMPEAGKFDDTISSNTGRTPTPGPGA